MTEALRESATTVDPEARDYAYQDDVELICTPPALTIASAAFETACGIVKLRANLKKTSVTLGRKVRPETMPAGLVIEPRVIVLKHGGGSACAVPALEARDAASGSLFGNNSPELRDLEATRKTFYDRFSALKEGGLSHQAAFTLLRTRVGATPPSLPARAEYPRTTPPPWTEVSKTSAGRSSRATRCPPRPAPRSYLKVSDGGLDMHSIAATAPDANAASWHNCLPTS